MIDEQWSFELYIDLCLKKEKEKEKEKAMVKILSDGHACDKILRLKKECYKTRSFGMKIR